MDDKGTIVLTMKVALDWSARWDSQGPVLRLYDYRLDVLVGIGALFVK
jgi:hypothetical protein